MYSFCWKPFLIFIILTYSYVSVNPHYGYQSEQRPTTYLTKIAAYDYHQQRYIKITYDSDKKSESDLYEQKHTIGYSQIQNYSIKRIGKWRSFVFEDDIGDSRIQTKSYHSEQKGDHRNEPNLCCRSIQNWYPIMTFWVQIPNYYPWCFGSWRRINWWWNITVVGKFSGHFWTKLENLYVQKVKDSLLLWLRFLKYLFPQM